MNALCLLPLPSLVKSVHCPERLDPDPVNIRPHMKPCTAVIQLSLKGTTSLVVLFVHTVELLPSLHKRQLGRPEDVNAQLCTLYFHVLLTFFLPLYNRKTTAEKSTGPLYFLVYKFAQKRCKLAEL